MKSKVSKMKNKVENQKPLDVVMNETLLFKQKDNGNVFRYMNPHKESELSNCVVSNWFIPIITNEDDMDSVLQRKSDNDFYGMGSDYPKVKLYIKYGEDRTKSIYVLVNKGGKLYKVESQKDYGIIKSRMEIDDKGRCVPYGKCDLVPFDGEYIEFGYGNTHRGVYTVEESKYKNGKRNGESFKYYKEKRYSTDVDEFLRKEYPPTEYPYHFELTTYVDGVRNGKYVNTKNEMSGNFVNNKEVGEWKMKMEKLITLIKEFSDIPNMMYGDRREEITVNYQNGLLNGEFHNDSIKGNISFGKLNGIFQYKDENSIHPHSINEYKNGKLNGISLKMVGSLSTIDREESLKIINNSDYNYLFLPNIMIRFFENGELIKLITLQITSNKLMKDVLSSEINQTHIDYINQFIPTFDKSTFNKYYRVYDVSNKKKNCSNLDNSNYLDDYNLHSHHMNMIKKGIKKGEYPTSKERNEFSKILVEKYGYKYYEIEEVIDSSGKWDKYNLKYPQKYNSNNDVEIRVNSFIKDDVRYIVVGDSDNYEYLELDNSNSKIMDLFKKTIQKYVDKWNLDMEIQLKEEEELKRIEKEKEIKLNKEKEKERLELGISLSSFPMD